MPASATPTSSSAPSARTRRRVKVIGRLPGERSCLSLVWAVLDRASRGWRGVNQTIPSIRLLAELRRELFFPAVPNDDELRPRLSHPPRKMINEEPASVGFYTRYGTQPLLVVGTYLLARHFPHIALAPARRPSDPS